MTEGAVLIGGESRRMGHDKASLPLVGPRMAEHVAAALESVVGTVRFVGGSGPGALTSRPWIPDLYPGEGPLAGIHAALTASASGRVLVVACDLPLVAPSLLAGLEALLSPTHEVVVPVGASGPVPVCAAYGPGAASAAEAHLRRGQRSARELVASLPCRYVKEEELAALDPSGRSLWNVNTPAEHREAEQWLSRRSAPKRSRGGT